LDYLVGFWSFLYIDGVDFFADDVDPSQNTSRGFIVRPLPEVVLHWYKRLYVT